MLKTVDVEKRGLKKCVGTKISTQYIKHLHDYKLLVENHKLLMRLK